MAIDVALTAPENVLAGHDVHHAEPVVSLYLPGGHAEQVTDPPAPVYPSLQLHASMLVEPTGLVLNIRHALQYAEDCTSMYVSAGHSTHGVVLLLSLYLPSAHPVHGPPAAPSKPVLHVQFVTAVAAMCGS